MFPLFGSLQRSLPTLQACSLLRPGSPKIAQVLLLRTVEKIIVTAHNQHLEICFHQRKQIEIRISSGTAPSACRSKQAGCQTRVEFFLQLAISSKWCGGPQEEVLSLIFTGTWFFSTSKYQNIPLQTTRPDPHRPWHSSGAKLQGKVTARPCALQILNILNLTSIFKRYLTPIL